MHFVDRDRLWLANVVKPCGFGRGAHCYLLWFLGLHESIHSVGTRLRAPPGSAFSYAVAAQLRRKAVMEWS
jgi:hypothetical protein